MTKKEMQELLRLIEETGSLTEDLIKKVNHHSIQVDAFSKKLNIKFKSKLKPVHVKVVSELRGFLDNHLN